MVVFTVCVLALIFVLFAGYVHVCFHIFIFKVSYGN